MYKKLFISIIPFVVSILIYLSHSQKFDVTLKIYFFIFYIIFFIFVCYHIISIISLHNQIVEKYPKLNKEVFSIKKLEKFLIDNCSQEDNQNIMLSLKKISADRKCLFIYFIVGIFSSLLFAYPYIISFS